MNEEQISSIKSDYLGGESVAKIAKKNNITVYAVNKIIKNLGIKKDFSLEKLLIRNFLKQSNDYAREMMSAKKLVAKYPEADFWEKLDLGFKLNSLAYFFTVDGQALIKRKYAGFKFDVVQPKTYNMKEEKIGEDVTISYRPKTLKDFLK